MNRRETLKLLQTGLVLSSAALSSTPLLAHAATAPAAKPKPDKRPVALLLPLTGPRAALGLSMAQAASLVENAPGALVQFDTGGTAAGAAQAAQAALRRKCAMILGPLLSEEAGAVATAAGGRVPVLAFTNDRAVQAPGAHVFGITASQATTAMLRYARSRGVRDVLVLGDGGAWSAASAAAAISVQAELGMTVRAADVIVGQPAPNLGDAPDAVLVPGDGEAALAAARNLRSTGVQLLATVQALDYQPAVIAALEGAWMASPDPDRFDSFASRFEARHGGNPGAIAALAYDAATIVSGLRAQDLLSRDGLLNPRGFECVTGPVRFRTDGSCARQFAILAATNGVYEKVAVAQGT